MENNQSFGTHEAKVEAIMEWAKGKPAMTLESSMVLENLIKNPEHYKDNGQVLMDFIYENKVPFGPLHQPEKITEEDMKNAEHVTLEEGDEPGGIVNEASTEAPQASSASAEESPETSPPPPESPSQTPQ